MFLQPGERNFHDFIAVVGRLCKSQEGTAEKDEKTSQTEHDGSHCFLAPFQLSTTCRQKGHSMDKKRDFYDRSHLFSFCVPHDTQFSFACLRVEK